jgi:hypothetical protein
MTVPAGTTGTNTTFHTTGCFDVPGPAEAFELGDVLIQR